MIEAVIFFRVYKEKRETNVLGEEAEINLSQTQSPTDTPSPSPTPTVTASPSPSPTIKPTPSPVPQPDFTSEEINGFIDRFAAQYSLDPNVLRHLALCESGFDAKAIKLSYYGLFQFGPTTWKNIRLEMGEDTNADLRLNAEEATQTAAYAISVGKSGIWPNCIP